MSGITEANIRARYRSHEDDAEGIEEPRYSQIDVCVLLGAIDRLRKELAAAPKPLVWTRKKPTIPGWYWIRLENGWPTIMRADQPEIDHPKVAFARAAEFAGPLPEPQEPKPRATPSDRPDLAAELCRVEAELMGLFPDMSFAIEVWRKGEEEP